MFLPETEDFCNFYELLIWQHLNIVFNIGQVLPETFVTMLTFNLATIKYRHILLDTGILKLLLTFNLATLKYSFQYWASFTGDFCNYVYF